MWLTTRSLELPGSEGREDHDRFVRGGDGSMAAINAADIQLEKTLDFISLSELGCGMIPAVSGLSCCSFLVRRLCSIKTRRSVEQSFVSTSTSAMPLLPLATARY